MKTFIRVSNFLSAVVYAGILWVSLMLALGVIWGAGVLAFRTGFKLITNF